MCRMHAIAWAVEVWVCGITNCRSGRRSSSRTSSRNKGPAKIYGSSPDKEVASGQSPLEHCAQRASKGALLTGMIARCVIHRRGLHSKSFSSADCHHKDVDHGPSTFQISLEIGTLFPVHIATPVKTFVVFEHMEHVRVHSVI